MKPQVLDTNDILREAIQKKVKNLNFALVVYHPHECLMFPELEKVLNQKFPLHEDNKLVIVTLSSKEEMESLKSEVTKLGLDCSLFIKGQECE